VKNTKPNTVHTARTIMFLELSRVMNFSIEKDNYLESMVNNVFGKKSQDGIKKTTAFLTQLYSFSLESHSFQALKYFWSISNEEERAQIAFLYALNNDYLLQESKSVVSKCRIGDKVEIEQVEKGATTLLIPLNARKQLNELSDDMVTKINIQYYTDLKDCLIKTLMD
jgi:hypothetical protein